MITFFFRKQDPVYHSIEGLFEPLAARVRDVKTVALYKVPYQSNSVINLLKNVFYARRLSSAINHVTGDVHYIILGLKRTSFNILTIHDCIVLDRTPRFHPKYWFYRWMWYIWPIRKADIVTVISEKTKLEIIRLFPFASPKLVVIPNFVNPQFVYTPKVFNAACPVILQIGSNPNKNRLNMLQALKGIKCHIDFIGELSDVEIKLLNEYNISYTARTNLAFSEIIEAYQKSDIVFFASTYEGFGMPIIEAQAMGRVIMTSNISPMKEHAGEGAFLVDPYDVESIREGFAAIFSDSDLRENKILEGLENVKKYSFDAFVERFSNIYEMKNSDNAKNIGQK